MPTFGKNNKKSVEQNLFNAFFMEMKFINVQKSLYLPER